MNKIIYENKAIMKTDKFFEFFKNLTDNKKIEVLDIIIDNNSLREHLEKE
jgi:predicted ABC-class ATPase